MLERHDHSVRAERPAGTRDMNITPQPDVDLSPLEELATRRQFQKGRLIGVQGQEADSLCIIISGQVLLSRFGEDGEDYALYLLGPGQLFGEGSLHPERVWMVSARAMTDGEAYMAPAHLIPRLFQHYPNLARHILNLLSFRLERAHRRLDVTHMSDAKTRLIELLRAMAHQYGEADGAEIWMPLPLTQTELGQMIGLARETVARMLAQLERDGLIRREGRKGLWLAADGNRLSARRYSGG
ncbi:MAG: Crp/Fnr family transcriptional regulator [Actinomycetota bacterium]